MKVRMKITNKLIPDSRPLCSEMNLGSYKRSGRLGNRQRQWTGRFNCELLISAKSKKT
jgi:hypothetical protein